MDTVGVDPLVLRRNSLIWNGPSARFTGIPRNECPVMTTGGQRRRNTSGDAGSHDRIDQESRSGDQPAEVSVTSVNIPPGRSPDPGGVALQEVPLNWNNWLRQIHRWLAVAFTVSVVVTFVALAQEEPVVWVSYVPLLPLALLLLTGLYLFALPYAVKWRRGRRVAAES
jgi:hypothetical protein